MGSVPNLLIGGISEELPKKEDHGKLVAGRKKREGGEER